jgi:hypothetical protein
VNSRHQYFINHKYSNLVSTRRSYSFILIHPDGKFLFFSFRYPIPGWEMSFLFFSLSNPRKGNFSSFLFFSSLFFSFRYQSPEGKFLFFSFLFYVISLLIFSFLFVIHLAVFVVAAGNSRRCRRCFSGRSGSD